ncbi:hypothetical protein CEXT_808261 [Caerostris extrusa]|uniref:Uncharacterized protein n=1 Tax=Caerostris extrusa TaxID=172846 RepID=A0AAV4NAV8_CAEEX|nr:hypothetical protein CEXT_808261 [Caerostris extrusa]
MDRGQQQKTRITFSHFNKRFKKTVRRHSDRISAISRNALQERWGRDFFPLITAPASRRTCAKEGTYRPPQEKQKPQNSAFN